MTLSIRWWPRKADGSPDYDRPHFESIHGENAAVCMGKYGLLTWQHDLAKYTKAEIYWVYDD